MRCETYRWCIFDWGGGSASNITNSAPRPRVPIMPRRIACHAVTGLVINNCPLISSCSVARRCDVCFRKCFYHSSALFSRPLSTRFEIPTYQTFCLHRHLMSGSQVIVYLVSRGYRATRPPIGFYFCSYGLRICKFRLR